MRVGTTVLLFALVLSACSTSRNESRRSPGRHSRSAVAAESARGNIDFEDDTVEGNLVSPDGVYLESRRRDDRVSDLAILSRQPYPDVFFKNYGVNPTIDTAEDPRSTFSVDVDTGSYTLARGFLEDAVLPDADGIRVEEFINAFDYGYDPPTQEPFSVSMEAYPSPNRQGYHVLQIGMKGRVIADEERKPANLVFVVDTSGSMQGDSRLGLVKHALSMLVEQLREGDTVGIVGYGSRAYVALEPTSATSPRVIIDALNRMNIDGATNAQAGMMLGYQLAARRAAPGINSRVILCSDGVANNGITDADGIFNTVKQEASHGITLTTVGFGMGHYNDVLMERLADQGDGFYAYVDKPAEAQRIFVRALTGTLQVIAKDVKVQVEFNPESVSRYRLLGYENRHLRHEEFDNDRVDAGEIGAGHAVTALYEVKLVPGAAALGSLRVRHKEPEGGESRLRVWTLSRQVVRDSMEQASSAARLAFVSAGFAEKLRQSYWARTLGYHDLMAIHATLPNSLANRPDVVELGRLIQTAQKLDRRGDRFEAMAPQAKMDFDTLPVLQ